MKLSYSHFLSQTVLILTFDPYHPLLIVKCSIDEIKKPVTLTVTGFSYHSILPNISLPAGTLWNIQKILLDFQHATNALHGLLFLFPCLESGI
jgi:hypothetical protein